MVANSRQYFLGTFTETQQNAKENDKNKATLCIRNILWDSVCLFSIELWTLNHLTTLCQFLKSFNWHSILQHKGQMKSANDIRDR